MRKWSAVLAVVKLRVDEAAMAASLFSLVVLTVTGDGRVCVVQRKRKKNTKFLWLDI